jgi:hypothetical protein
MVDYKVLEKTRIPEELEALTIKKLILQSQYQMYLFIWEVKYLEEKTDTEIKQKM